MSNSLTIGAYTIAAGKAGGLDKMVASIFPDTSNLTMVSALKALDAAQKAQKDAEKALSMIDTRIKNGTGIDDVVIPTFSASGFANLSIRSQDVETLNDLMGIHISPELSWQKLIDNLRTNENEASRVGALVEKKRAEHAKSQRVAARAMPNASLENPNALAGAPEAAQDAVATPAFYAQKTYPSKVIMKRCGDLFPQAYGGAIKLLNIEVPTLETRDPDVPAIDPSYKFFVPVLVQAMIALTNHEIIWLHGDSGCGKSQFWEQIAARTGMPFTRLNMDGHLTRGDIIGVNRMVPNAERRIEMRFIDGILPRAMVKPGLLLIDEMDLGDPEIMAVLQPVLEGEPLRILEDQGRIVRPHPNFHIAITGNTTGLGSANNAYVNAHEQSAATRDRIAAFVEMPYMTPQIEKQVIMERMPGIDEPFLDNLIKLANAVRTGYKQGAVNQIFSTRATLAAARRYQQLSGLYSTEKEAVDAILEVVVLNRMDEASRSAVRGYIDNIFA